MIEVSQFGPTESQTKSYYFLNLRPPNKWRGAPSNIIRFGMHLLLGSLDKRNSLVFSLNKNLASPSYPGLQRPGSAFFTVNPLTKEVTVEIGAISPNSGKATLHNELLSLIDYNQRRQNGMGIFSGHVAALPAQNIGVALIDRLSGQQSLGNLDPHTEILAQALIANGVLPISADGFPIFM